MGRILRWGSLQLCQSLVNGLYWSFVLYFLGLFVEKCHIFKCLTFSKLFFLGPVLFTRYFSKHSFSSSLYCAYFLLDESCLRRVCLESYPTPLIPVCRYAKSTAPGSNIQVTKETNTAITPKLKDVFQPQ